MQHVTSARRWGMFAILMLAGIAINISQLKISPITSQVSAELGCDFTQTAWLTSVFTIAGIVLSLPGSTLMGKLGPKRMLMALMAALVVGNLIGALTLSYPVMLASRIIEGISCALVIPVGLSLISFWFSGEKSFGAATGIFTTANPIANFLVMNISLPLVDSAGTIKIMWVLVGVLAAASLVLVKLFIVDGYEEISLAVKQDREAGELLSARDALRNPALIALSCGMACLAFVLLGLVTCFPQIFASYGVDSATANFYTSLNGLAGIPIAIVAGTVIGRTGKPFESALVGALGTFLVALAVGHLGPGLYIPEAVAAALFPGGIAVTCFFMLAPELAKRPEYVPVSTGLLNTAYYLGIFISTPALTALSDGGSSWAVPSYAMAGAALALIVFTALSMCLAKTRKDEEPDIATQQAQEEPAEAA